MPEELHRRSSVSTSLLRCSWNHTIINLVDPPGALSLLGVDRAILSTYHAAGITADPATWDTPAPLLRDLNATLAADEDQFVGQLEGQSEARRKVELVSSPCSAMVR